MKNYALVSGSLFAAIALVQLFRLVAQVPWQVGTSQIPYWVSVVAVLVAGGLAIWAFRLARR